MIKKRGREWIAIFAAIGSILVWFLFLTFDLSEFLIGTEKKITINIFTREALLSIFSFCVFIYFKFSLDHRPTTNYLQILKSVLFIGLGATITIIIINFIHFLFRSEATSFFVGLVYHINLALGIVFIVNTIFAWKKLILYHKSTLLLRAWNIFEYTLLATLIFNLIQIPSTHIIFYGLLAVLGVLVIYLCFHLRWIGYLNVNQKLSTLLFVFLIIIDLSYFLFTIINNNGNNPSISIDIQDNVFILVGFAFVSFYSLLSLLVLVFHLPTSSVFEQRINQLTAFQKLNQSIQVGDYVYDFLFESVVSSVLADAAWLEVYDNKGHVENILTKNILERNINLIKHTIAKSEFKNAFNFYYAKGIDRKKIGKYGHSLPFESILIVPIYVNETQVATLVLLKDIRYAFNKEMIDVVNTFVDQARISISNFRLLPETILRERYKEELEIAKRVQKKLLPEHFLDNPFYDIGVFAQSADQVGGDYYDFYKMSDHQTLFVIGDVSGKGTSAAFNMAQMKGVFQALAQLNLDPHTFLVQANYALARCLEKTSFITLIAFIIDTKEKKIILVRGGHCPALYYQEVNKEVQFLNSKGIGLGIILDNTFAQNIELVEVGFQSQDMLLFYTDGITEARNKVNEEYGYDRLQVFLKKNHQIMPTLFVNQLIEEVLNFSQEKKLEDDYTILAIKFK